MDIKQRAKTFLYFLFYMKKAKRSENSVSDAFERIFFFFFYIKVLRPIRFLGKGASWVRKPLRNDDVWIMQTHEESLKTDRPCLFLSAPHNLLVSLFLSLSFFLYAAGHRSSCEPKIDFRTARSRVEKYVFCYRSFCLFSTFICSLYLYWAKYIKYW